MDSIEKVIQDMEKEMAELRDDSAKGMMEGMSDWGTALAIQKYHTRLKEINKRFE